MDDPHDARPPEPDRDDPGPPPAGLPGHLDHHEPWARVGQRPHPVRHAVTGLLLAGLAGLAVWGALVGAGPARLDSAALGEALGVRTEGLNAAAVAVTEVGSTVVMALLATLVGLWSWARGRKADAVFVVGAMAGGVLLFRGIKIVLDRPRPPAAAQVVNETNESLPSGHATMAVVVIGSLVVLAWAGRHRLGRALLLAAAVLWVGAVGATRVYLGVHWFSDVVAGWLVGGAWLALCAAVWSRRRARTTVS